MHPLRWHGYVIHSRALPNISDKNQRGNSGGGRNDVHLKKEAKAEAAL